MEKCSKLVVFMVILFTNMSGRFVECEIEPNKVYTTFTTHALYHIGNWYVALITCYRHYFVN